MTFEKPKSGVSVNPVSGRSDIKFGYCTEFIVMLEKDISRKRRA